MFYLTTHSTHFIYDYMVSDKNIYDLKDEGSRAIRDLGSNRPWII